MNTVTALCRTKADAEIALRRLEDIGIAHTQISTIMTDETRGRHFRIEKDSKADEGLAAGATTGGLVGAVLGALFSAATISIPGLNLVATGAVVSSLTGLGAGAAVGGLVGGLIGSGIPEHEAKTYEKEIASGGVLLAVTPDNDDQERDVKKIFDDLRQNKMAA